MPDRRRHLGRPPGRHQCPSSSPRAWAIWWVVRRPWVRVKSSGRSRTGRSGGSPAWRRCRWPGPGPAHGDGEAGRLEDRRHRPADPLRQDRLGLGRPQLLEDLFLALAEQLGQDPVDHHGGQLHRGLLPHPRDQLEGLVHRHLLGRGHRDQARLLGVGEDVEHPVGLAADQAHLDQVVDGLGRRQLADDVPAGRRVDHDQVVVPLAHLVAELADGQDLAHARRGGGHEVERLGQRPDAPHHRDAQVQFEVLAQARPRCPWTSRPRPARSPAARNRSGPPRRGRPGRPWRPPRRPARACRARPPAAPGRRPPSSCPRRPCR